MFNQHQEICLFTWLFILVSDLTPELLDFRVESKILFENGLIKSISKPTLAFYWIWGFFHQNSTFAINFVE